MELTKIERLKELINKRDSLLNNLKKMDDVSRGFDPQQILFKWKSNHCIAIDIPFGKRKEIEDFLKGLIKKEIEEVENWIKSI